MSIDTTISSGDEEFDDDDDEHIDTQEDTSTPTIQPQPQLPPGVTPLPNPIPSPRRIQQAARQQAQADRAALKERKADFNRQLRRDMQDETRHFLLEKKAAKQEATSRRTAIASQATSERIQAYTTASSLGFAGYVVASLVDQFAIRPTEDRNRAAERQYTRDYDIYQDALKNNQLQKRRAIEDRIREVKTGDAIDYDSIVSSVNSQIGPPTRTITETVMQRDIDRNFNITEVPTTIQRAIDAVAPVAPVAIQSAMTSLGPYLMAGGFAVQGLQALNKGISNVGASISNTGTNILNGSTSQGLSSVARMAKGITDPFNINPVTQVAVTGFETLLSLVDSLKGYAEQNLEFSPQALMASVEGDIDKLVQSIRLGQENDQTKALVIRLTNQLDMAWNELKSELFKTLGPALVLSLTSVTKTIQDIKSAIDFGWNIAQYLPLVKLAIDQLQKIAANTQAAIPEGAGLFDEIEKFLDPNNYSDLPALNRQRQKQPRKKP